MSRTSANNKQSMESSSVKRKTPGDTLEQMTKSPTYFRNIDFDDLMLVLDKPYSALAQHDVTIVKKSVWETDKTPIGKREKKMIVISSPPCRIMFPSLHGAGDFPTAWNKGVDKQELGKAQFNITMYEGELPESMISKMPNLQQEQKDFFDFLEKLNNKIIDLIFDHPELRDESKERTKKRLLEWMPNDGEKNQQALLKRCRQEFHDSANVNGNKKTNLVRECSKHINGRYIIAKRSISTEIKPKVKPRSKPTGTFKDGEEHYIDRLLKDKRDYLPPLILSANGRAADLGTNENPCVFSKDIGIMAFIPRIYDCGSFGTRLTLSSFQMIRKVSEDEMKMVGTDYMTLMDDDDDVDLFCRKKTKKEEDGKQEETKDEKTEEESSKQNLDGSSIDLGVWTSSQVID